MQYNCNKRDRSKDSGIRADSLQLTADTFPVPVKTNVSGPSDLGIIPSAIS